MEFKTWLYILYTYGYEDYSWPDDWTVSMFAKFQQVKAEKAKPTLEQRVAALEKLPTNNTEDGK